VKIVVRYELRQFTEVLMRIVTSAFHEILRSRLILQG
jgi:hypothetical protein